MLHKWNMWRTGAHMNTCITLMVVDATSHLIPIDKHHSTTFQSDTWIPTKYVLPQPPSFIICERICEKGPFGAHFRFWVRHMAWKYIWWASFCTLLRCASLFRCRDMLAQSVEWQEVCFRENGPKHLLPVKTVNSAYCRVTNDIIASMADSAQHTVSFTAVYLMWTSPETSTNYGGFFWKASRNQRDGAELRC